MLNFTSIYRSARQLPFALLLLTGLAANAEAQELRYQSVWNSGSGSNIVTEPLSRTDFVQRGETLTQRGLRLIDVETAVVDGRRIYAGVWVGGSGSNIFDGPMTLREFRDRRQELRAQGLRLVDFEVFRDNNGRRRFIGVWRSGSGEERLSRPRNAADFTALGEDFTARGLRLVDVEVERNQGELQYRGLWREGSGSNLFTTPRRPSAFRALRNQMVADGLELVDMERIGRPGNHRFVGVWASGNGESRLSRPRNFEDFVTFGEQQTANGRRTQDLEIFLQSSSDSGSGSGSGSDSGSGSGSGSEPGEIPPWVQLSSNPQIVVDFGTMIDGSPRITLPSFLVPSNNEGETVIPSDFCGLDIRLAQSFEWQTQAGQVVETSPYIDVDDLNDAQTQADLGGNFYLMGVNFTGPIGQCAEDNNNWQFNYPLTENSGDSPTPNLRLVIEVLSNTELEFLDSN